MPDNKKKNIALEDWSDIKPIGTSDKLGYTGAIASAFGNTDFGESRYDDPNLPSQQIKNAKAIEQLRGERQGWGAETAAAIGGGIVKIPFTIIGNIASMLDFEDYYNTDNEVGNAITTWAEEVKGDIEEATKIYKSNDNTLGSREWWMNNAKGLIDSGASFAITGGTIGKGIQLLSNLSKGSKIIQGIGTVTNAAMLNQAESIPIAMDVYKNAKELGRTDEEAADAAAYSININRINIPLNLTSVGAFLRPIHMTRQIAKDVSKKQILGKLLSEGAQEYTEENVNMIAENEAKRKALDGKSYTYNFNRTIDEVLSKEGFETGVVGFLGGIVQTGLTDLGKSFQKDSPSYDIEGNIKLDDNGQPILVSPIQSQKERFKAQQKSLSNIELLNSIEGLPTVKETLDKIKTTSELLNDIQLASIDNNEDLVKELKNTLLTNQAYDAFKNGTTDNLIQMYKSIANDNNSKEKFGEDVHKTTAEAIKQIEDLEKVYQKYQGLPQINEVFNNRSDHYFNLKQADVIKHNISNATLDQSREIEITNSITPEQINDLVSTKELQGYLDKLQIIKDNVLSLNKYYNEMLSPEYTTKKVVEKEQEPIIKEKEIEDTFKEPKQEPVDITSDISTEDLFGDVTSEQEIKVTNAPRITVDSFVDRLYKGEQPSTEQELQFYSDNIDEITEKLNVRKENAAKINNIDYVSESLNTNTAATTKTAEDQIIQSPKEVSQGMYSDISKGISSMANVVMMKLFGNYYKDGVFRFERTDDGLPELDNTSNINIETLNIIQQGDEVSFELVPLEGKNLENYNKSKEESIRHINHNITNMGNSNNYPTNDKNYGFDDKHIAIKFKGELIGFVQQPHATSNDIKDDNKQSYIDARNTVLAQRKAIIDGLAKGPVTTRIKTKGAGNLYTKLDEDSKIDLVNDLFSNPRPQDLTPGGRLIFVYNDGTKLDLPAMDDSNMESDIKSRLSELGNWGSKGSVYQLVKDTTNNWYPIPVYSNLMDNNSIKGVLTALKGLSDTSVWSDVVNALNPFIYSSVDAKKNAPITIDDKDGIKLIIDGKSYSIDGLNKGIGLSDFKSALNTKQQNIAVLNINSKYTQEDIKNRNTLATNAITFKGEYLVQPFLSYEPIGKSEEIKAYDEVIAKPEVGLQLNDDNETESLLDKIIKLKGEDNDPGFSRTEFGDLAVNRKEFDKWLNKNLPGLTLSDIQDLKELKTNITDAIGAYRNMVIYLFKGATNKTAYHEAFHGVFRNLLSNEQRFELLEEAITKYPAPTEADLDYLQEGLESKASREQLTALWYEEKLADDFAEFTADIKPIESFSDKIKAFFKKIVNFFDIFTLNNQSKIDKLFNNINKGKLAKQSTVNKKNNLALINKELKTNDFTSLAYARSPVFNATVKWDRTKSIGDSFMNTYQSLKSQGKENISPENIFKMIYAKYASISKDQKALEAMTSRELTTLKNILDPTNFTFLQAEATKYLEVYGLNVKTGEINYEDTNLLEENIADEEITSLASQTTKGLGEWVTQAGLKSASVRLKMFLSSIPVTDKGIVQTDVYGFTKFHDFNQLYYFLERSLTGLNTFEDMLKELQSLADVRPEVNVVIDKLTKPDTFTSPEELTRLQNDFKSNFNKQQLTYSLVKFDTNSDTGEVTYRIFDANRMSIEVTTAEDWKANLTSNTKSTIAENTDNGLIVNGTKEAIAIKEQYANLSKQLVEGKAKYDVVNKMLLKIGVEFSPEVLKELLVNGSKTLDFNLKQVLDFHANTNPTEKDIQTYNKAFKELVKLETSGVLLSYTQSFNNVENSNIYTIQLPSFASKLLDDLTSRDFNKFDARLTNIQKDPLYKYSNLLTDLKTNNNYRTSQFRMSYLDGLKDEKGNKDGSKFTNMSPKDFMSMQIALFQNRSSNENKVLKDKVSKYIYITPSDKSMAMIFDAKSYNTTLTNGDITVNTPIVNQFYNVLLGEVARIKQQLEVKAKVLSSELTEKDLLEHYHYKPKSDMKAFDGFAYQIMHFGEGFNNKFNKAIVDSLGNSEDIKSALSNIEQDLKLEIVEQLKKDFKATINEALSKGVISETSRGVYKSNSLDFKGVADIKQTLADFSLNTWLNNIEMSNLLNGDVALYKAKDLQKRTYQSGAMGVNINSEAHPIARTKVVKDFYSKSDLEALREFAGDVVDNYSKNNVTDAQVLVSPEFYKAIMVGRGTWNDKMQTAYDIAEGIITNPTSQQLKDARLQLSNIKPFYFGNRYDEVLGIQRYEQVKCAMLPLFKSYIKTNPLLATKRADMDNDKLDMIAFESSFKAAIGYRSDITSDASPILELDMNNFMVQVDNPAHIIDEENDSIRQLKMLILGNIDPNVTYNGKVGKDIIADINELEGYNLTESLNHIVKLITGKQSGEFKEYMKEMLTKRNATDNIMEALNIIGDEFEYALDNGSSSAQVENLISSLFTNKVIKQAFEGGSGVQASSIGMKYKNFKEQQEYIDKDKTLSDLQSDLKYFVSEDGNTFWSEAIMPAWSKKFFNADGTHKDNIPDNLKELLFYRIPTEGFHSMMPIKVKSFLPVEYGNTILMSYEVTSQFGADFDFDKIYFLAPEFDSNLNKITYDDNKSIDENTRSARNNKILDNYLKVLSSKEILPLILNPSGFDELARIKADIDRKDNIQPKEGSFFSSVTQRDYKTRNHVGIGLKGQLALHVSGHSYATLLDLISPDITFNGVTENNLSKQYGLNGNLISKEVSALMAAILDDIKNPIIQALGVNEFTADVWATIVRAGFDSKTAVNFVTQPVIVELSQKLAENNYKIKSKDSIRHSGDTLYTDYENHFKDIYKLLTEEQQSVIGSLPENSDLSDEDLEFYRHWKAVNVNKLNPNEGRTPEAKSQHNLELAKYYQFELKVLDNYNKYDRIAKDLVKINRLFGINKEVGPNFEDIVNKKYLLDEIESQGFSISGLNRETLQTIKPLSAAYNTQIEVLDYLSKYFPYDSSTYNNIKVNYISNNIKADAGKESLSKVSTKLRMLMNGFIRNYIDYKSSTFESLNNSENKEQLFTVLPSLLKAIKSSDNDSKFFNGALRKNVFIDNLQVKHDDKSGLSFITVKANRMDIQLKNNISESIVSLFNNKDTRPLIENLINYSFVATGFHTGLRSFHDLIPPIIFKELGYADYRKVTTNSLQLDNYKLTDEESNRLVDQMVRNFPNEFTKAFDTNTFNKQGVNLKPSLNLAKMSGRAKELIINYDDVIAKQHYPIYTKYLRVYDSVAKKSILYEFDDGVYKPISRLGKAGNIIEINTLEDIKVSLNKENNLDNKVINDTFVDETNTNESNAEPVLNSGEYKSQEDEYFGDVMGEEDIKNMLKPISPEEGTDEIPKDC